MTLCWLSWFAGAAFGMAVRVMFRILDRFEPLIVMWLDQTAKRLRDREIADREEPV